GWDDCDMRSIHPAFRTLLLSFLFLWTAASWTFSKQKADSTQTDSTTRMPASVDGTAQNNQNADPAAPKEEGLPPLPPGVTARVLKEGEKPPQREDVAYEDWSKPELSVDMTSEVVPLIEDKHDSFTREFLHAQWRNLDPIDLWVVKPDGVKHPPV